MSRIDTLKDAYLKAHAHAANMRAELVKAYNAVPFDAEAYVAANDAAEAADLALDAAHLAFLTELDPMIGRL